MEEKTQAAAIASPVKDFTRVMRLVLKSLRYASLAIIGVTAVVVTREVASAFTFLDGIHPVLGWLFLVVFFAALYWFVARPVMRYWRLPPALRQPRLPVKPEAKTRDVAKRLGFVLKYLGGLRRNPRLEGRESVLQDATTRGQELFERMTGTPDMDASEALSALDAFERKCMEPLLQPLDEEANKVIRQEALAVGIGTAVSMNGTVDAFIVLWRNANLVARVATIYFGRPGLRGSLFILRDVAAAMFLATQMQGIMQGAANLFGGFLGRAGSLLVGPAGDGAINAVATIRIGYVAKARCRAFRPWNSDTLPDILKRTMKEVASQASGVVKDVLSTVVKGGLIKLPAELARKAHDLLSGLFGREKPEPTPEV